MFTTGCAMEHDLSVRHVGEEPQTVATSSGSAATQAARPQGSDVLPLLTPTKPVPTGTRPTPSTIDTGRPPDEPSVDTALVDSATATATADTGPSTTDDATAGPPVEVRLTWDADVDLDLHVARADAALYDVPDDVSHCNPTPDWGRPGHPDDDPVLDTDTWSVGPESVHIAAAADDTYRVLVHYYGVNGYDACIGDCTPTTATVELWVDEALLGSFTATLTGLDEVWEVATLQLPDRALLASGRTYTTSVNDCP
jgi:hypothetical protein